MNTYEINTDFPIDHYFETNTMNDMMKLELLREAAKRYTIHELEERLGTKSDLESGKIKSL